MKCTFVAIGGPNAVIASVTPSVVRPGHAVSISGSGFGDVQGTSAILIGGTVATVVVWSTTHVVVKVPALSNGAYLVETNAVGMRHAPPIRVDQAAASLPMPTFVSMTLDDTYALHQGIRAALAPYGMHATVFVNSVRLGKPGFLSVPQVGAAGPGSRSRGPRDRRTHDASPLVAWPRPGRAEVTDLR